MADDRTEIDRRMLEKSIIAGIAMPTVLRVIPANAQSRTFKIGNVSPRTGPLAAFGEAARFRPRSSAPGGSLGIAFKSVGAELVTGDMIPPNFATFWGQCAQQGFRPKRGIWWTPTYPFKSGLNAQSLCELCDAFTK